MSWRCCSTPPGLLESGADCWRCLWPWQVLGCRALACVFCLPLPANGKPWTCPLGRPIPSPAVPALQLSGGRASPLGPPDSLPFGPCLFSIWSYVQFPTQSWMNEGIVSLINQAEEKPVVQALLFVLSPVLTTVGACWLGEPMAWNYGPNSQCLHSNWLQALPPDSLHVAPLPIAPPFPAVLVSSLASTLAYLALWPLSSSLAIIRAALAIICATLAIIPVALGLHHEPAAGGEHVPVEAGGSLEGQPLPPAREPPPAAAAARPTRQRRRCAACGVAGGKGVKLRTCARCRQIRYCGSACQSADWARHRSECAG